MPQNADRKAKKSGNPKNGGKPETPCPSSFGKLIKIFLIMFRVGLFTFGGGLAMIPQMSRDFKKQGWLEEEEILDVFSVAQSLPGVMAVNASVLIGYRLLGVAGAAAAALGAVLPSLLVIMGVTLVYDKFITNPYVLGALRGIRAAVVALLFSVAVKLRKNALNSIFSFLLFAAAAALAWFTKINVVFLLLGGAAAGLLYMLCFTRRGKRNGKDGNNDPS